MASAAAKIEALKVKQRSSLANIRRRQSMRRMESSLIRKGAILTTGGVYGALNRFDVGPGIGNFPWKVGVAGLAWIGEALTSGPAQDIFGGVGDATLAIYVERAISNNTLVAGAYTEDEGLEVGETVSVEGGEL